MTRRIQNTRAHLTRPLPPPRPNSEDSSDSREVYSGTAAFRCQVASSLSGGPKATCSCADRAVDCHRTALPISRPASPWPERVARLRSIFVQGVGLRLTGFALLALTLSCVDSRAAVADPKGASFNWEQMVRQIRSRDLRVVGVAALELEASGAALSDAQFLELLGVVGGQAADAAGLVLDAAESHGITEGRLGKALLDSDVNVRRGALLGLARVWVESPGVLEAVAGIAKTPGEDALRFDALDVLSELPVRSASLELVVQAALTKLGRSTDGAIRVSAIEALGRRGVATPEAIGIYRQALDDPDARVRISGVLGSTCLGPMGRPLSSVVLRRAADASESPIGRQLAVHCLRTIGVAPEDRLEVLRNCSKWLSERRGDSGLRQEAVALALDATDSAGDPGFGQCLELALTDPDPDVVAVAVDAISRRGEIALSWLARAIDPSGAGPSDGHLRAVGALGANARVLTGAVEHWAFVDGFKGRVEAACCLIRLDAPSERLLGELRRLLKSGSLAEKFAVITTLAGAGESFGSLFPDLEDAAERPDPEIPEVAFAIRRLGHTENATRVLGGLLTHGDAAVRAGAARALAELSVHNRSVREVLLAASSSSTLAYTAIQGLGELTTLDTPEILAIRRCLVARSSPRLRAHAAAVLAAHGALTSMAEGALRTTLSDREAPVLSRRLACSVLAKRPSFGPATVMKLIAAERYDSDVAVRESARTALSKRGTQIDGWPANR